MDEDNHGLTPGRPADREPTRAPGDAAFDETSVVEDPDPITQLRERLKAMAAAEARMRAGPPPGTRSRPRATDPKPVLERVERNREADDERRRQLWRDSATILIGVVLVLLVGQTFFPGSIGGPAGSPTPMPSAVGIGSFGPGTVGPPATPPPGATFGPILNPSIPIDATPTPIPVITMGPTPTASLTPAPTRRSTPKPTVKPPPTPAAPTVQFTWSPNSPTVGEAVQFNSTVTGQVSTYSWNFDEPGGTSAVADPTYTFLVAGSHLVTLTVTGPGGSDAAQHTIEVIVAPSP